jgi:glycosyltransferase involved in cell wall biosynthesis
LRIAVVTVQVPFVRGGSEVLADALCGALRRAGHQVELIALPFSPQTTDALLDSMAACRLIELGLEFERVIALKFPAYLVRHPHKVLWLIHQHHGAYERWGAEFGLGNLPDGRLARQAVIEADRLVLGEAEAVYAISRTVANRLEASHGLKAPVLFPPPRGDEDFWQADGEAAGPGAEGGGYLFFPSRLAPAKRQELALRALALAAEPVRLVFAGAPDRADYGQELAELAGKLGVAERVEWRGFVPDQDLRRLYAGCRAVLFPPHDEDYGYIGLEAMLAGKPVITCHDSGGTLEFVQVGPAGAADASTGYLSAPAPAALAAVLDQVWREPEEARRRGAAARRLVVGRNIGWQQTLDALLGGRKQPAG